MRIGIDARFWGLENTGIGRYVMELVNALLIQNKTDTFVLFLRQKYFNELDFHSDRVEKVLAEIPHYSFAEQIRLPRIVRQSNVELMHFLHFNVPIFYRGPFVVTIHDLIKHFSRGNQTTTRGRLVYWLKYLGYLTVVRACLVRARAIIVPSRWWQKELTSRYRLSEKKVKVVYEAAPTGFEKKAMANLKKTKEELGLPNHFVVYIGNLYPHKNVMSIVQSLVSSAELNKLKLVIVCARNIFTQRFMAVVKKLRATDRVQLVGFVSDAQLKAIYAQALAFVFPSRLEGFGLPGLEAMAVGLPVVAAQASCLPEVYGRAALYFQPDRPDQLAIQLKKLLAEPKLRKELVRRGFQQFSQYSWEKAARETREIYRQAVK